MSSTKQLLLWWGWRLTLYELAMQHLKCKHLKWNSTKKNQNKPSLIAMYTDSNPANFTIYNVFFFGRKECRFWYEKRSMFNLSRSPQITGHWHLPLVLDTERGFCCLCNQTTSLHPLVSSCLFSTSQLNAVSGIRRLDADIECSLFNCFPCFLPYEL